MRSPLSALIVAETVVRTADPSGRRRRVLAAARLRRRRRPEVTPDPSAFRVRQPSTT